MPYVELFLVVKEGVEHMPIAEEEAQVILLEPKSVLNTGDAKKGERTQELLDWI